MSRVSTALDAIRSCGADASWLVRATRGPLRVVLWLVMRLAMRIRVEGEPVPGPAVIASNHPNLLDGLLVLMADTTMRPIARWHRFFVLRLGFWIGNCIITSRGTAANPQRGAYAESLAHVQRGGRLWIAVEGKWQPERTLLPPRTGAVRMAHAAAVPLQVLGIRHALHPGPDASRWPWGTRPLVVLRWGPCVTTTGHIPTDNDRMMAAIAETAGMRWDSPAGGVNDDRDGHLAPQS
jgi:1-acyl-sn-glycerol-3-phosphate acyltransferase